MTDLTWIPLEDLMSDLVETKADIIICQKSLAAGITEYSGGTVQKRLNDNVKIEEIIEKEIKRRNQND